MHDAAPVRAIMRWSVALLMLLAVGACGSTAKPGPDGGGGSNAGGAGGTTGGGGRGGGSGGAAGAVGGQSGGGGTGGCAPNQVWCPGCEPGTGTCYAGGCPGVACPPPDGGAGASGSGGVSGSGGTGGRGGTTGSGGRGGDGGGAGGRGGSGGSAGRGGGRAARVEQRVRRARLHEQRALRASQLWRHGSAVQSAPRWRPMSDGMDVSGFLQHLTDTGARLRGAAVHASRSFLHHAARVVRRHGHLLVPPGERLPDRRRMRLHQWRRSPVSVGLTASHKTTSAGNSPMTVDSISSHAGTGWLRTAMLAGSAVVGGGRRDCGHGG